MKPIPGEIWLADLGLVAKFRPVVILSRRDPDPARSLVTYVPLTTQNRSSRYEVPIPKLSFLKYESVVNVQGIGSLPTTRLGRKLGHIPGHVLLEIRRALVWALDINMQDVESVAGWLHGVTRDAGHASLVRNLIRGAAGMVHDDDGYGTPEVPLDEVPDDGADIRNAIARFAATWDECERECAKEDEQDNTGNRDPA